MTLLYHHPLSSASRAIRLTLSEYEIAFDVVEERVHEHRADFLDINPAGSLPVLVDGEKPPVIGAYALSEYLDETVGALKPAKRLFPGSAMERAEMRRLVDWALTKLEKEVVAALVHERVTKRLMASSGGGAPDSTVLRTARSALKFHLSYLDFLCSQRDWISGNRLSFADLAVAAGLSVLDYLGEIEWTDIDNLKDWYSRMKSRPAFRPLLADRVRGVPPVSHYVDLDF